MPLIERTRLSDLVSAPDIVAPAVGQLVLHNPWGNSNQEDYHSFNPSENLVLQFRNTPEAPDTSQGIEEITEEELLRQVTVNNPDHL